LACAYAREAQHNIATAISNAKGFDIFHASKVAIFKLAGEFYNKTALRGAKSRLLY
jgi:hypothetical protein